LYYVISTHARGQTIASTVSGRTLSRRSQEHAPEPASIQPPRQFPRERSNHGMAAGIGT